MKKIILGGLILSSLFVGITNAFIMPINEETTFGDGTIICDENFNCITENANGDTFNGISPSFLTKRNWFVFFNSGLLSEVYGFNTLKTYYVQKRPIEICRTDYNSAINYTQTVTDYLSGCANNINTGNAILWSEENLGGKITSYTINTIGSNNGHSAVICANYNEDIKSACFNVRDNLGNNYDFGISDTIFNRDNFVGFGLAEASPRAGGGGEDEPTITGYDPETGLPCATIDTIIKYETNYNTGICYSTPFIMSGNQIIQITPKSFTELRSGYNEFRNDINKYHNYCTPPATNEACQNAFGNEEEKRNLINKIPEGLNTKVVYDYCHMYLTYSGDTNICEIDDEELWSASYEDLINAMNEITVTQPGTGSVFDNYKDQTARNIITALPSVYYKITSIFRNNTGVKGIIPSYITWIIILIVLFKLFKK